MAEILGSSIVCFHRAEAMCPGATRDALPQGPKTVMAVAPTDSVIPGRRLGSSRDTLAG
jgi:hypothetical protein